MLYKGLTRRRVNFSKDCELLEIPGAAQKDHCFHPFGVMKYEILVQVAAHGMTDENCLVYFQLIQKRQQIPLSFLNFERHRAREAVTANIPSQHLVMIYQARGWSHPIRDGQWSRRE